MEANQGWNLSFELFGARNPITIKYDVLLDVNLLFGVQRTTASICTPDLLNLPEGTRIPSVCTWEPTEGYTALYNKIRAERSEQNQDSLVTEGMVFYLQTDRAGGFEHYQMFKCKPEEIELIHWTASGVIGKNIILNTILNAYENWDSPTYDNVEELLKEEFEPHLITKNRLRIEKLMREAEILMQATRQINAVWATAKQQGFDITKDKRETMRFMSQHFPKRQMKQVGAIVLAQAGLL